MVVSLQNQPKERPPPKQSFIKQTRQGPYLVADSIRCPWQTSNLAVAKRQFLLNSCAKNPAQGSPFFVQSSHLLPSFRHNEERRPKSWRIKQQIQKNKSTGTPPHQKAESSAEPRLAHRASRALKPRERLRPRAFSNFRPLDRTWGAVVPQDSTGIRQVNVCLPIERLQRKSPYQLGEAKRVCLDFGSPGCFSFWFPFKTHQKGVYPQKRQTRLPYRLVAGLVVQKGYLKTDSAVPNVRQPTASPSEPQSTGM